MIACSRLFLYLFAIISIIILNACSFGGIPIAEYSKLKTPQETFEFAQKAVAHDDHDAFYYCLAEATQKQISMSDFKMGWALAGNFFYLFLSAKVQSTEIPAPEAMFQGNPETAKMVLKSDDLAAAFLLHLEADKWKLFYPSPYPLPDISKFKQQEPHPWRNETLTYYRDRPEQWFDTKIIDRSKKQRTEVPHSPAWRAE